MIEDHRARQLCIDVRHSLFYETCATYGFNVDRVFSEGELTHTVKPWGHSDVTPVTWSSVLETDTVKGCFFLFFFSSCSEDRNAEETGSAPGLQIPPKLTQSLGRLHTWICIPPRPGTLLCCVILIFCVTKY